jgi:hypothetical protein
MEKSIKFAVLLGLIITLLPLISCKPAESLPPEPDNVARFTMGGTNYEWTYVATKNITKITRALDARVYITIKDQTTYSALFPNEINMSLEWNNKLKEGTVFSIKNYTNVNPSLDLTLFNKTLYLPTGINTFTATVTKIDTVNQILEIRFEGSLFGGGNTTSTDITNGFIRIKFAWAD